ncbi:MAG: POTRA domain-containing protein, partial [Halomonas sp.]|nr:POTRA domain-containing protein [Halomonas sp.]
MSYPFAALRAHVIKPVPLTVLSCLVGLALVPESAPALADQAMATSDVSEAQASNESTRTIRITDIEFTGNQRYSDAVLTSQVADRLNRPLTFAGVRAVAERIEAVYHEAGYTLARVVVPEQAFGDGILRLSVLEGRLGRVEVRGNTRYVDDHVLDTLAAVGLRGGQVFTFEEVERGLTLINRRSGVEASSTLAPGKAPGTTDLIIDVEESPRVTGAVEVNNYGSEDTGEYRLVPSLSVMN